MRKNWWLRTSHASPHCELVVWYHGFIRDEIIVGDISVIILRQSLSIWKHSQTRHSGLDEFPHKLGRVRALRAERNSGGKRAIGGYRGEGLTVPYFPTSHCLARLTAGYILSYLPQSD